MTGPAPSALLAIWLTVFPISAAAVRAAETAPPAPPAMTDIHDIRPPVVAPSGALPGWPLGAAALLALAGVFLALRRRRGAPDGGLSPAQRALQSLEELAERPAGDSREHYRRLSRILRRYLAERFGFRALEMTSGEVAAAVTRQRVSTAVQIELADFLRASDAVRWGERPRGPDRMQRDLSRLRLLVRETSDSVPGGKGSDL